MTGYCIKNFFMLQLNATQRKGLITMTELINRAGIPVFIQIVLESWNGVFLLIMMFSLF